MKYSQFRIAILTFALSLASVSFLTEWWSEVKIDLPQVQSDAPIFVVPKNPPFYKRFTTEDLIQNRDLSLYDSGGEFSNCFNHGFDDSEFKKCRKQLSEARSFIVKHFKDKKRGYILYEWSGIDSGSETHIFIEPDDRGKWHLVLRSAGDFRYQSLEETKGSSLKYKRATEDDYPLEIGTYFLSILDENKKEIEGF